LRKKSLHKPSFVIEHCVAVLAYRKATNILLTLSRQFFRIPELMATKTILKRSRNKSDSPFKQSDTGVTLSPPKNTVKLTFNAPAEELTDEDKEQVN
jgi:hypothetical protein